MVFRSLSLLILLAALIAGCTPTHEITYSVKDVPSVTTVPEGSPHAVTRKVSLNIQPFADVRNSIPENLPLFVRDRETEIRDTNYCINAEKNYEPNRVPAQIATIIAAHFAQRRTFKAVSCDSTNSADYYLTGNLKRLYGMQRFSTSAKIGSMFGLIGAIATAGATTPGNIVIEMTDLTLHRKSDGAEKKLANVSKRLSGDMHADAECWCIYNNVDEQLKAAVENLIAMTEQGVAEMESSKPQASSLPQGAAQ